MTNSGQPEHYKPILQKGGAAVRAIAFASIGTALRYDHHLGSFKKVME